MFSAEHRDWPRVRVGQNVPLGKIQLPNTRFLRRKRCQLRVRPRKNACGYGARVSGATHYNYFRSYDARTGRYTQPDPIGLDGGWNRFGYAAGNPLGHVDPDGLRTFGMRDWVYGPGKLPQSPGSGARPVDPFEPDGPQYSPVPTFSSGSGSALGDMLTAFCVAECSASLLWDRAMCLKKDLFAGLVPCLTEAENKFKACAASCESKYKNCP